MYWLLIKNTLPVEEKRKKNGFCVFFPATQEAIKHNSFLCPEKKLEQGNIEEAFEKVDQIVEGKSLRIFDRIFAGFHSETDTENMGFPLRKSSL